MRKVFDGVRLDTVEREVVGRNWLGLNVGACLGSSPIDLQRVTED